MRRESFKQKIIQETKNFQPDIVIFHYAMYQTIKSLPELIKLREQGVFKGKIMVFLHDAVSPFLEDDSLGKNNSSYWSQADTVICVSNFLKKKAKKVKNKYEVLYPSVDDVFIQTTQQDKTIGRTFLREKGLTINPGEKLICYIARFYKEKGFETALRIAKKLADQTNYKFLFVGATGKP
ncbi:MAG: glycosyltransferase family 4 protein [Nanoarchaeota archaeon]|nr:glycosyltransferase family 4 protein [Nanoarchaeota archaeon]